MKKPVLKTLAMALVIGIVIPMLAIFAPTVSAESSYAEDSNWLNTNPNAPGSYAYSIAVVGDTQSIVKKDLTNGTNYLASIYSWLAANKDAKKIRYVLGVGDITEYTENFDDSFDGSWTYDQEWNHAKAAITLLDNKIPYSLCRGGGHDTVAKFNEYFASHSYYTSNLSGSLTENDVTNTYSMFEVGSVKYLLFALDWNPSDTALKWAEGIIAANPNRKVIITTHSYLNKDGTLHGSSSSHSAVPTTNNGVDIYNELVSKYDNIQLVICGHDPSANIVYRQDARESGSVVTSLLVDPQTFDSQNNAETGMVCMLYFSEDGNDMTVEWYSTVRNQYYRASNQFSLKLDSIPTDDGGIVTKYGVIPAKYADANAYPFLAFQNGELLDLGDISYDAFYDATGSFERKLRNVKSGGTITIIARKNFTVTSGGEFLTNYQTCPIVFDLMGHTIDASAADALFASNGTQNLANSLTVKNGSLVLGKSLITVANKPGDGITGRSQTFNFENLDIVSNNKELLTYNASNIKQAGFAYVNFTNCNISSTNLTSHVYRSSQGSGDSNLLKIALTVTGGSTTLSTFNQSKFVQEFSDGSVTFLPNEKGEMHRVIIPTSATVTDTAYKSGSEVLLYLVEDKANTDTTEYVMESLVTPYGTIPYDKSSHVDYPFLAFVDGAIVSVSAELSDLFYGNVSGTIERATRSKTSTVTVILRTDYSVRKHQKADGSGTVENSGQLLTNYRTAPFVIDLMGHTLSSSLALPLFASNGAGKGVNPTVTVKNGKIVSNKAIVTVANKPGEDGKTQSFVFEDLDVVITDTSLIIYNTTNTTNKGNYNFDFIDCDITFNSSKPTVFNASSAKGLIVNNIRVTGGVMTFGSSFQASKFVIEEEGCAVTFLPDENGDYTVVRVINGTDESFGASYNSDNGQKIFALSETKDGYGIYVLTAPKLTVAPMFSLTLYTDFVYNVYVPVKDYVTSITLGTTVYNDLSVLNTMEIGGATYYHLTMKVGVTEAGSGIALAVTTTADTQSWTVSVIAYASSLISGDSSADEKTLASDILSYVRAAYAYAKINDGTAERINAIIGTDYDASNKANLPTAKMETAGLASARFMLSETPYFVFYPELDGSGNPVYDLDCYVFSLDGKYLLESYVTQIDGKTAFVVKTYAFAVDNDIVYFIDGMSISGTYNVGAYYKFATELADAELITLIERLIRYAESAESYRAKF